MEDRLTGFDPFEKQIVLKEANQECHNTCLDFNHACVRCPIQKAFDKLSHYEDAEEDRMLIRRSDIESALDEAFKMHPYKVPGNFDSYAEYNQGWEDACDWICGRLNLQED